MSHWVMLMESVNSDAFTQSIQYSIQSLNKLFYIRWLFYENKQAHAKQYLPYKDNC